MSYYCESIRSRAKLTQVALAIVAVFGSHLCGQSTPKTDSEDVKARMKEMTQIIDGVRLEVTTDGQKKPSKRKKHALLRTIETSRNFGGSEDGSLWLFEHDGLPIAMVELWARNDSHNWGHTMLAVSSGKITGQVGSNNRWTPVPGRGVTFKAVPNAGKPRPQAKLRKAQMRQISRRFETNIEDPGQSDNQTFRLLTEPIHRYSGGDVEDGAIFAFVRGESNAEALLFLQGRDGQWEFGLLRCSSNELVARLDRREVWRAPQVPGWIGAAREPFWVVHRRFETGRN